MLVRRIAVVSAFALLVLAIPLGADADHSWGGYHWARTSNPFTIKLGDNVTSGWDSYLRAASGDWTKSKVLDAPVTAGAANPHSCRAATGHAEVCSAEYGFNLWLGLATIWVQGGSPHITAGSVKVNDSYFNAAPYDTPEWRRYVMCQEIGHIFGLDHQDEDFDNANLGTCMDYTRDPSSNQRPNAHDFEELELIYSHVDSFSTIASSTAGATNGRASNVPSGWGRAIRYDADGRASVFVKRTERGRIFRFVVWAR